MKKILSFKILWLVIIQGIHAQELIQDRNFQQGFYVRDRQNGSVLPTPIRCDNSLPLPVWNVAEWNSQSSVSDISPVTLSDSMCQWADGNKDFRFGPMGTEPYQLYLGVNSLNEYDSIYRQPGQPWPHLLIEQRLSAPFDFSGQGPGCPPLSQADSLIFKIDAQLLYNLTIKNSGYDSTIHAAQFLIFFTVQNLNSASSGYGKYVWLGIPLYDDRVPISPGNMSYDIGTQTLINNIPYANVANSSLHTGSWVHAQVDILPYARAALDTAWANGFLNESTNFDDYKIGGMNMGWELTGMNIATIVVKDISLYAHSNTTGSGREDKEMRALLYPCPAANEIVLNTNTEERQTLNMYGPKGNLIKGFEVNGKIVLDISSFRPGLYSAILAGNKGVQCLKLVIVR